MMRQIIIVMAIGIAATTLQAQEKAMRIHFTNGATELHKISDIEEITFEDYTHDPYAPEIPDDPNPPTNGYIAQQMVEGELMYYGHDPEYSPEGTAVYFLYLKDLNNTSRGASVCFYLNVPRQEKGSYHLPAGTYTAAATWESNTFNTMETAKYKSNWNVVDPKWTQYVASGGEFEVTVLDNQTYFIKGYMKGGSKQDDGSFLTNEAGIAFSYKGTLPITDYSSEYEDPEDPVDPVDPVENEIVMTTGNLYYYGDNEYYLQLKDKNPTDTYEITLYLNLAPDENKELVTGIYTPSADGANMTYNTDKSTWTFIDHEFYDDRVRYKVATGDLSITNNGGHSYTIKGSFKNPEDTSSISISFTGTLPFEDYSE